MRVVSFKNEDTVIGNGTDVDYGEMINVNSMYNNETINMQAPDNFLSCNEIPHIKSISE